MFRVAAAGMVRPAMAAGTATVMVVGGVTFSACDAPVVPYAPGKNLHDTSTYYGRVLNILDMIDPRTLALSDDEVHRCQLLMKQFETEGTLPDGVTDADMWAAKKKVDAVIHGPTGEPMLVFGRMSAFVPMNVPIAAGMILHGPTGVAASVFWQWVNQSYNVVNNYTNRGGTDIDMTSVFKSYALAVLASGSIAIGSSKMMAAYPAIAAAGPFVPYLAVISAGTANVAFTRMDEVNNGVHVFDGDGKDHGKSISAGRTAVFKTVTTRSCFLPIFPLLIPPAIMAALPLKPQTLPHNLVSLVVITACLTVALPMALAIEPGQMALPATDLEPEFQGRKDAKGETITTFYASKGL